MQQTLRDPQLSEQLAHATRLAADGQAAELAALIDAVQVDYGPTVTPDDQLLLAALLAAAHGNTGDDARAQKVLTAAEPLLPAASPVRQARFQSIAAGVAHCLGDHERAIDTALRALALVEDETRPSDDLRVTLGNCGMTLAHLELFPLAVETASRGIEVAAATGADDWVGRAKVQAGYTYLTWGLRLEHLGLTEQNQQRWSTAIDHFGGALDEADLGTLFRGWGAAGRAICAARLGRVEDSRRDVAYAQTLPTNAELERLLSHARASLLLAEGQLAEARAELLTTWQLTGAGRRPLWLQDVAWLLGRVALDQGDDAEALRWHREMHELYGRAQYKAWLSRATAARLRIEQQTLLRRNRELESDVLSDPLTGVPNRRAFDVNLPRLIAAAHATATPLTLALVDIDYFKRVNDTYGHPVGDEVLRRIARILREQSREADRCARYGGDELALCLPAAMPEATAALTRIARRIAEHPWPTIAPGLGVTVSTGLAELRPGDTATTLFWAADQSLLGAKRARSTAPSAHPNGSSADPAGIPVARLASPGS